MKARFVVSMTVVLFAVSCVTSTQPYSDEDFLDMVETGTREQVYQAIRAGANVNAVCEDGFTPLMAAAVNEDSGVTEVLLVAGADVHAQGPMDFEWGPGFTPLWFALLYNANPEVPAMLIEAASDVNLVIDIGYTPLMFATARQPPHIIRMLIEAGADVNARVPHDPYDDEVSGFTPLMFAVYYGRPEVIGVLLAGGADVNARTTDGRTPLMIAAGETTKVSVITALLDGGADANAKDSEGRTAIDYVERNRYLSETDAYHQLLQDAQR